jgi:glutathione S-transferase
MLTVHHLGNSQSERIVWLCEELEIPYELVRYEREPSFAAPPDYKKLSAYGTAPTIMDDGLALGESGAIVEYICRRHAGGKLMVDPEEAHYPDFLFWFHFANGSMVASIMADYAARGGLDQIGDRTARALAIANDRLAQVPYFAGDTFSAADIMMAYPLKVVRRIPGHDPAALPNVSAYLDRIEARPAHQRANAKAEPGGA